MSYENVFKHLKPASKPFPLYNDIIEVSINTEIVDQYSKAEFREMVTISPGLVQAHQITEEDLIWYNRFLLYQRILSVRRECTLWVKLKSLYITATIQSAISMVGKVEVYNEGFIFMPVIQWDIEQDIQRALQISGKLALFQGIMIMADDAMPRSVDGDPHVMQMANIAGRIMSRLDVDDPHASYMAAFLNLKLVEEANWRMFYRISYDDIGFAVSQILSDANFMSIKENNLSWYR